MNALTLTTNMVYNNFQVNSVNWLRIAPTSFNLFWVGEGNSYGPCIGTTYCSLYPDVPFTCRHQPVISMFAVYAPTSARERVSNIYI